MLDKPSNKVCGINREEITVDPGQESTLGKSVGKANSTWWGVLEFPRDRMQATQTIYSKESLIFLESITCSNSMYGGKEEMSEISFLSFIL